MTREETVDRGKALLHVPLQVEEQVIYELLDRPIAFHPIFSRITHSTAAGILLSQMFYWSKRTTLPGQWFYKTQDEWEAETTLDAKAQKRARAKLVRLGILDEELRGVPAKLYYHLNVRTLLEAISQYMQKQGDNHGETSMDETSNLDTSKRPTLPGHYVQSIPETTSEITPETTQKECAREETDFLKHTEEPDNPTCAAYLPGFPCPHMTEAVTVVAQVFWPTRPTVDTHAALGQFRSKELLHEAAHTYTPEQLTSAATWYRTNEPAHRLSLPLFFSGVYGHICNAEASPISTPTPADDDIVWNDLHEDDAAAPHYFHQLYRRGADIRCWSCEKRHREYTPLTEQDCSAHAWAELHGEEVST